MQIINRYWKVIFVFSVLSWVTITAISIESFKGSHELYILFSIVFFIIAVDCIFRPIGFSYFFLVAFLTLGFWAKLALHEFFQYPYLEPTGLFDDSASSWNEVLSVAIVGALAVFTTKMALAKHLSSSPNPTSLPNPPSWYPTVRIPLWTLMCIAVVALPHLNSTLGVSQSGNAARLVLPWPFGGLAAWVLGFGLIACVLTIVGWDHRMRKNWLVGFFVILLEGYSSATSSLSRAAFIFHTVPYIWNLCTFRLPVSKRAYLVPLIFLVWVVVLVASLRSVMETRYYAPDPSAVSDETSLLTPLERVPFLIVDRWVGLEGVMAVVGYPNKGYDLLTTAAADRREQGKLDFFTSEITKTKLSAAELEHIQYASIPGAFAFFYYTGSLFFVFLGSSALTFLAIKSERMVVQFTQNTYLASFWGMMAAQTVASFGLGLTQTIMYYGVCCAFIVFVWLVQRRSSSALCNGGYDEVS
ncbi:hypothetical protein [Rhizobium sp. AAP116]|uniref:hypothetical protein n=1 Tax=Rhizobium sp. AAP116 TaxID=1523429 RepID=UPI000AA9A397|nr:hypothetical protein [Rhizobium sp. AAP116]